ncbi:hypothetical protein K438DRAFT_1884928, partial [Mycena galopus ATCC 62051]
MADSAFEIAWSLALLDVARTAHQDCSVFHWTLFLSCCIDIVFSPPSKASGALGFCVRYCPAMFILAMIKSLCKLQWPQFHCSLSTWQRTVKHPPHIGTICSAWNTFSHSSKTLFWSLTTQLPRAF